MTLVNFSHVPGSTPRPPRARKVNPAFGHHLPEQRIVDVEDHRRIQGEVAVTGERRRGEAGVAGLQVDRLRADQHDRRAVGLQGDKGIEQDRSGRDVQRVVDLGHGKTSARVPRCAMSG